MAYVANESNNNTKKDDDDKKAPILSAGGSGVLSGSAALQTQTAPVAPAKTQATFTNIQKYLDQNKGAGQANTERLFNPVQQNIQQAKELKSQVVNQVPQQQFTMGNTQDLIRSQPLTDANLNTIRERLNTQYSGPTAEQLDWSATDLAAKQARDGAERLKTESGRIGALEEQQGNNRSRGVATLDNLFIQADPTARGVLSDRIGETEQQANSIVSQGRAEAGDRIAESQRQAEAVRAGTQKTIQDLIAERRAEAEENAKTNLANNIKIQNEATKRLEQQFRPNAPIDGLSALDQAVLGLDPQTQSLINSVREKNSSMWGLGAPTEQKTYTVDPRQTMGAETRARLEALGGLVGQDALSGLSPVSGQYTGVDPQALVNYLRTIQSQGGNPFTVDLSGMGGFGGITERIDLSGMFQPREGRAGGVLSGSMVPVTTGITF